MRRSQRQSSASEESTNLAVAQTTSIDESQKPDGAISQPRNNSLVSALYGAIVEACSICLRHLRSTRPDPLSISKDELSDTEEAERNKNKGDTQRLFLNQDEDGAVQPELEDHRFADVVSRLILWGDAVTSASATEILSPVLYKSIVELLVECGKDVLAVSYLQVPPYAQIHRDNPNAFATLTAWLEKGAYLLSTDAGSPSSAAGAFNGLDSSIKAFQRCASDFTAAEFQRHLESLDENTEMLMELMPSIEQLPLPKDDEPEAIRPLLNSTESASDSAHSWFTKIRDSYPQAPNTLVRRLARSNQQRFEALRTKAEHRTSDEPQNDQSVLQARSTFHDSGIGTSLGQIKTTYARSVASHGSLKSAAVADGHHFNKCPPTPVEVAEGQPFMCKICKLQIRDVRNREGWKKHIFRDIGPYICLSGGCAMDQSLFPSRETWSEHDKQHRRINSFYCDLCKYHSGTTDDFNEHISQKHAKLNGFQRDAFLLAATRMSDSNPAMLTCPLCEKQDFSSLPRFASHVCSHMEDIALSVLPQELYGDEDEDEDEDRKEERGTENQAPISKPIASIDEVGVVNVTYSFQRVELYPENEGGPTSEQILAVSHDIGSQASCVFPRVLDKFGIEFFASTDRDFVKTADGTTFCAIGRVNLVFNYVLAPEQKQNIQFWVLDDTEAANSPLFDFDVLLGRDYLLSSGALLETNSDILRGKYPPLPLPRLFTHGVEDLPLSETWSLDRQQPARHAHVELETKDSSPVTPGSAHDQTVTQLGAFRSQGHYYDQIHVASERGVMLGDTYHILPSLGAARVQQRDQDSHSAYTRWIGTEQSVHSTTDDANTASTIDDMYFNTLSNMSEAEENQHPALRHSQPHLDQGRPKRNLESCQNCRKDKKSCDFSEGPWNEEQQGPPCNRCRAKDRKCGGPVYGPRRAKRGQVDQLGRQSSTTDERKEQSLEKTQRRSEHKPLGASVRRRSA